MNLDTIISILDPISKLAETLPYHWVAIAGFALAGLVVALRKYQASKPGPVAEVVQLPKPQTVDAPATPQAAATVADIAAKTLNKQ